MLPSLPRAAPPTAYRGLPVRKLKSWMAELADRRAPVARCDPRTPLIVIPVTPDARSDIRHATDAELVRQALQGSDQAFGEIVRRYQDLLYRHAERMTGRQDDAEDVVQSAFIKAHRNLRKCRDPERVGAWLFRIGANTCKDFLKSKRVSIPVDQMPGLPATDRDPEREVEMGRVRHEIERALQSLPVEQREAFLMKHVEGWSYYEMSETLDVSVPALKMRVHRAREELQVLLQSYGS
jgi:RNA polymerase sigma-70 factor (ECF subfamily)